MLDETLHGAGDPLGELVKTGPSQTTEPLSIGQTAHSGHRMVLVFVAKDAVATEPVAVVTRHVVWSGSDSPNRSQRLETLFPG